MSLNDLEPISINIGGGSGGGGSSSFGPGIELLMNDKVKSASKYGTSMDMDDLDRMEEEFSQSAAAEAAGGGGGSDGKSNSLSGFASSMFNWGGSGTDKTGSGIGNTHGAANTVQFETDSYLGEATAHVSGGGGGGHARTYDGFTKINEVPLESSSSAVGSGLGSGSGSGSVSAGARMNDRERRRYKRMMLKKLEDWYEKGVIKDMHRFTLDSSFEEIEDEYETALEDKRKKDSIKLQGWWFMTFVNSVEYANAVFNPFDLNLDGWGEQVSEDLESYDEIFGELYQKYKGGKMSPELSLLLRIGFSATMVNFTNKALSTSTPGFQDVIKQSPELMKMFTNATVQSMSQSSPGFAFANNIVNGGGGGGGDPKPNTSFGPPPAPVQTKPMAGSGPGNGGAGGRPSMQFTRPDLAQAQSRPMFREQGVDLQTPAQERSARPEMRGPQNPDIQNLLAGLKTREVSMPQAQPQMQSQNINMSMGSDMLPPMPAAVQQQVQMEMSMPPSMAYDENESMISATSLQDLQNATLPKRTRRKKTSERNTISLDI
jgi:hypothetical protein